MVRHKDAVCRPCRWENMELYLEGDRCLGDGCAIKRRNYVPVGSEQRRTQFSEHGLQLRENRMGRRTYGVLESQFRRCLARASHPKEVTGSEFLVPLERRLDSVLYIRGFAESRAQTRRFFRHGHFGANGHKECPVLSRQAG